MRRRGRRLLITHTNAVSGFLMSCATNMIFHFRRSIPAWLLLAAYHIFKFPPLWTFFVALGVWFLWSACTVGFMRLMRTLAYMSGGNYSGGGKVVHVDADTPSKNPYSATREKEEAVKSGYSYWIEGRDYYSEIAEDTASPEYQSEAEGKDYYAEYMASPAYQAEQATELAEKNAPVDETPPEKSVFPTYTDEDGRRWATIYSNPSAGSAEDDGKKSVFE